MGSAPKQAIWLHKLKGVLIAGPWISKPIFRTRCRFFRGAPRSPQCSCARVVRRRITLQSTPSHSCPVLDHCSSL